MSRIFGIVGGIVLAGAVVWTVAAQTGPQSLPVKISQVIPVVASVPVSLDDGTVQTVTVPLTITLDVAVSVDGAVSIGAEADTPAPADPIADTVTVDNAADFLPTLEDMPEGWRAGDEGAAKDNQGLAADFPDPEAALKSLDEAGRQGGYLRQFQSASLDLLGNMGVVATLVVFDTPQGAAKGLDLYHERDQGMVDAGDVETLSPINAPSLGDKSEAYTMVGAKEEGSPQMDAHSVAFQKGNALVFVQSYAFKNGGDVGQLINLAKEIEQRLP